MPPTKRIDCGRLTRFAYLLAKTSLTSLPSSFGTAFAFLAQLALTSSVWKSYTQWLWRAAYNKSWTIDGLNDAFGADTAPSSLLSRELWKNFKLGTLMAFSAW
jgi:hypothetical protein